MQTLIILGSIMMFLAVALGAFGAHALKRRLSADMIKIYETGVQYHLVHGSGIILLGLLADRLEQPSLVLLAGWLLFAGILLFSGSLYVLSVTGVRKLGAITPLGGVAFLAGWVMLFVAAL
ncbi:DUF423 domain-containing protein [Paenibacillus sp. OK076]|uniref:DUF423 domain-containing protein n=1 Tax=Paenibacillus sp. OK076 TaxID=1884379 RepID=UPI0008BE3FF8|nr:DUF423 domain-containing protein [Paenibacillus sp. OK076]SEN03558.1 Uncharacterized membrane protein YgdD, TMEM256/DUF423 family [Paenibacillus sp. OK076]